MFSESISPKIISKTELDQYLSKGWFRMGQTIFTTNFLNFNNHFYSAIWLRSSLDEFNEDKKLVKFKKAIAGFTIEIRPAFLTDEKEELFDRYKTTVTFEASSSLANLLYGKENYSIYDTYEVVIFDEEKLIACGFFDIGKESAEGISSFYDPDYKKYSLGKLLIYLKMNYCKSIGLKYFYAGYFVPHYPAFDYKLEIGKNTLQYFNYKEEKWFPLPSFIESTTPLEVMYKNLKTMEQKLKIAGIEANFFYYEFYNANLVPEFNQSSELLDYPMFLYLNDLLDSSVNPIIVFDVRLGMFKIIECGTFYKVDSPLLKDQNYTTRILFIENVISISNSVGEIISFLLKLEENTL